MSELYVSDVHGYSEKLGRELLKMVQNGPHPDKVICLGDINGSPELDAMQKIFYNKIVNLVKGLSKDATDEEIYKVSHSGCLELEDYIQNIWHEFTIEDSDKKTDRYVKWAKQLISYTHYGHFISCLPPEVTSAIKKNMIDSVQKTISILSAFCDAGSKVIIVEGNWDVSSPLDFYPTPSECKRLPVKDRALYLKEFVLKTDPRIQFVDKITEIEDEKIHFYFLPFDEAINYKTGSFKHPDTNKQVILVSHAPAMWSAIKGETPMTGEGKKIEENMKIILHDLLPDAVFHGHLHDQAPDYSIFSEEKPIKVFYLPEKTFRFIDF